MNPFAFLWSLLGVMGAMGSGGAARGSTAAAVGAAIQSPELAPAEDSVDHTDGAEAPAEAPADDHTDHTDGAETPAEAPADDHTDHTDGAETPAETPADDHTDHTDGAEAPAETPADDHTDHTDGAETPAEAPADDHTDHTDGAEAPAEAPADDHTDHTDGAEAPAEAPADDHTDHTDGAETPAETPADDHTDHTDGAEAPAEAPADDHTDHTDGAETPAETPADDHTDHTDGAEAPAEAPADDHTDHTDGAEAPAETPADDHTDHTDGAEAPAEAPADDHTDHTDGAEAPAETPADDHTDHTDGAEAPAETPADDHTDHTDGAEAPAETPADDHTDHTDGAEAPAEAPADDHTDHTDGAETPAEAPADDHTDHTDGAEMPAEAPADDHTDHTDGAETPAEAPADDHTDHTDGAEMPAETPADDHTDHTDGAEAPADDHTDHTDGAETPAEAPADDHTDHTDGAETPAETPADDHTDHTDGAEAPAETPAEDHTDHGDHGEAPAPPSTSDEGMTPAEIEAFVAAVRAQPETHMHGDDPDMMAEHMAAMALTPRDEATHIAIKDGNWFDPDTWHNGEVPPDDAKALIPEGVSVDYDALGEARLFTVRVDGELSFATDADSEMKFDTMVVSPTGRLEIGTEADPIQEGYSVDLIVANNGPIDVEWDPTLLSRGIISHGETSIHGAVKDSHEKVVEDPMAGDSSVTFDAAPEGWEIGDTIVIAGTTYEGHKWDNDIGAVRAYDSEDEVRVITGIEGNTVHFDTPLDHDHDSPRDDLKTSVANYSRNVTVSTEDPDTAEVHERGHVMFMHSDDVDVRYAEFNELGRTDKSEDSFQVSDFDTIASDSNVQGRYSLHLHRTGVDDLENPAHLEGNAVWGSPGWGYVHHDSNAVLENNASFDTFGAGFVAETGNETGAWTDNIAIYAQGESWDQVKNITEVGDSVFDTAKGGHGFWFQGRLIDTTDNVAASVNVGYVYFHRGGDDREIPVSSDLFEHPDAFFGKDVVGVGTPSILDFAGNETFASHEGLHVVKTSPNQGNDVWSHIDDFTAWNVESGVWLEYTAHYLLTDLDLVAKEDTLFSPAENGISFGKNVSEIVVMDSEISGFNYGATLQKSLVNLPGNIEDQGYIFVDTEFSDLTAEDFLYFDPDLDWAGTASELTAYSPNLELDPLVADGEVRVTGTKFDGLGQADFPGGTDEIVMENADLVRTLATDGYWTTSEGDPYFLMDIYFTDRATGDIYFETQTVTFDDFTGAALGQRWWQYGDAKHNGVQDIVETPEGRFFDTIALDQPILASPATASQTEAEIIWDTLTEGQGVLDDDLPEAPDVPHEDVPQAQDADWLLV